MSQHPQNQQSPLLAPLGTPQHPQAQAQSQPPPSAPPLPMHNSQNASQHPQTQQTPMLTPQNATQHPSGQPPSMLPHQTAPQHSQSQQLQMIVPQHAPQHQPQHAPQHQPPHAPQHVPPHPAQHLPQLQPQHPPQLPSQHPPQHAPVPHSQVVHPSAQHLPNQYPVQHTPQHHQPAQPQHVSQHNPPQPAVVQAPQQQQQQQPQQQSQQPQQQQQQQPQQQPQQPQQQQQQQPQPQPQPQQQQQPKKRKMMEKIVPSRVKELVPESQAYMEMLAFERKLDFTITRKRTEIQEAIKRPIKQKRRLRIFITNIFFTNEQAVPSWELRIEGRLADETSRPPKRKFSSFFKSLVIELDSELYGPDNHLVEWHRSATTTNETDGFQVKRPGDRPVKCTILMQLEHQASQFKLDARLARLLGKQVGTRPAVINALWQYIKTHKLQDAREREYINCDLYFQHIFECKRMKFSEIPAKIMRLLGPPDPIKIEHLIQSTQGEPQRSIFDIDVEVDDNLKTQMNNFLVSTSNVDEIQTLDEEICEILESINQSKTSLEFFSGFAHDPLKFINRWLASQAQDLKLMTDQVGGSEEERRAEYYYQPWMQEAVCRYFYRKVQQRRAELEHALTSKK